MAHVVQAAELEDDVEAAVGKGRLVARADDRVRRIQPLAARNPHQILDRIQADDAQAGIAPLEMARPAARAHADVEHGLGAQPLDKEGGVVERLPVLVVDADMVALVVLRDVAVVAALQVGFGLVLALHAAFCGR